MDMEDQKQINFTFEVDNFLEKESMISSPNFLSGGCEWFVNVHPKGHDFEDHLSLFLCVANPETLRLGWKRRASFSFVLLTQSGKELCKLKEESCKLFCAQFSRCGWKKAVPLKMLHEKVCGLFKKHPDIATNFKPKNQLVKTAYMNILLGHIEALDKPPHSLSDAELSNAYRDLIELTEAGFKLDWLKKKLCKVIKEREKNADGLRVQEHIKTLNIKLNQEKVKSATSANKDFSMEQTMWNHKAELDKEKAKSSTSAAKDWLEDVVHSWNKWKLRVGFTDLGYKKID
ncbi:unnamed protein product [Thlaspi arvense]|uniref:MATH domain-containing protein n=1 Tax=Thlaspi arvense TaxID=13288 RepID=A0AAU9RUT5_THLAR|nr:unnamed protein product [Thlaspi arvense]